MDMNMICKDPLGEEIRAHVYTAAIVHEPCRIVGIELHHDSKDMALILTADEAGELGDALLKGAKELGTVGCRWSLRPEGRSWRGLPARQHA